MAQRADRTMLRRMNLSYGVVWRKGRLLPLATGKLELLPRALKLEGRSGSLPVEYEVAYDDLASVHVGREPTERIDGRPSLVIEPRGAAPLLIASVSEPGVVGELAERLAALQPGTRTAVVLPLVAGAHDAVRELLAAGPPFDPQRAGLERHEVFLTPTEVVFIFESRGGAVPLDSLLADPAFWQEAGAWTDHIAAPPRLAEAVYSWARPSAGIDTSLLPPGLRDSDG